MRDTIQKRHYLWFVGLVVLVAVVGLIVFRPGAQAASVPKEQDQINLIVDLGKELSVQSLTETISEVSSFNVDSFFDIMYVSNIGSSGQDGVRFQSSPTFDVFFDVFFEVDGPSDDPDGAAIPVEMVALSLTGTLSDPDNPAEAIDEIRQAITDSGGNTGYLGHVTVLK